MSDQAPARERDDIYRPQIIIGYGAVNPGFETAELARFEHEALHRNLSTVMVMPTTRCKACGGSVPTQVVDALTSLLQAPNQKFAKLWTVGMEVGYAYDALVATILNNEEMSKWRYLLTVEQDNLPYPLAFINLVEAADQGDWDVLGGLYFSKNVSGFPQIWGDPDDGEENFRPLNHKLILDERRARLKEGDMLDPIIECQGTGMGFTLFRMDLFKRCADALAARGADISFFINRDSPQSFWTQDLYFFHKLRELGIKPKVGIHTGVRVGHMDVKTGAVW